MSDQKPDTSPQRGTLVSTTRAIPEVNVAANATGTIVATMLDRGLVEVQFAAWCVQLPWPTDDLEVL